MRRGSSCNAHMQCSSEDLDRWHACETCKGYVDLFWGCLVDKLGQGRLVQGQIIAAFDIGIVKRHCCWRFWYIAQQPFSLRLQ